MSFAPDGALLPRARLGCFGHALAFLISAALLVGLGPMTPPVDAAAHAPVLRSVREGLGHLGRHAELRRLTVGMAVFNFVCNIAFSTKVLFARDRLHVPEAWFELLMAASAIGGLAAGYLVPKSRPQFTAQTIYLIGPGAWSPAPRSEPL